MIIVPADAIAKASTPPFGGQNVGSSGYYLKEDTLVFTATIGGRTIATVEISLKDQGKGCRYGKGTP